MMDPDKCKYCGGVIDHTYDHITEPDECFSCWHWRRNYETDQKEPNRAVIIDGTHYAIGDEGASEFLRGFGGRKFIIQFNDGSVVETTNLWHQGTISPYWRQFMPDNAKFIPETKWTTVAGGVSYLREV